MLIAWAGGAIGVGMIIFLMILSSTIWLAIVAGRLGYAIAEGLSAFARRVLSIEVILLTFSSVALVFFALEFNPDLFASKPYRRPICLYMLVAGPMLGLAIG